MARMEKVNLFAPENLPTTAWFARNFHFNSSHTEENPLKGKGFRLNKSQRDGCMEITLADDSGVRTWELDEAHPNLVRLRLKEAQSVGGFKEDPSISLRSSLYKEGISLPEYFLAFNPDPLYHWEKPPLDPILYPSRKIREIDIAGTCQDSLTLPDVEATINVFRNLKRAFLPNGLDLRF